MSRPKKAHTPDPDAPAAGYVRVSNLHFPDGCRTPDERADHVGGLRRVRMAELRAEAARHGDEITVWYDDLGVSARGEFLEKRTEFERARQDARRGRVRVLYARDLSRLFRDLVQQELWFAEMQGCGVTVRVQDLPYLADEATRVLVRQQLGAINEYLAARQGAVIRTVLHEKVQQGQWVGRMLSQWGLRYDAGPKAFAFDPATADKIRLAFEAFVEAGGVAERAADALNRMVREGHPRATRTPWDAEWTAALLLFQVRCPLYRRRIVYGDTAFDAPDRIPEAVPAALVAEADRLLAERRPRYEAVSRARRSPLPPFTYLGLLRCAACGHGMRAVKSCDAQNRADGRWVSWRCSKGSLKGGCRVMLTVRQARLDALIAEGLAAAIAAHGDRAPAPAPERSGGVRPDRDPAALVHGLTTRRERLARRRDRYLDLYARGVLTDLAVLKRHLSELDQEEAHLQQRCAEVGASPGAADGARAEAPARLRERFERAWAAPPDPLRDAARRAFLQEEGVTVRVRISTREAGRTYNPASTRPTGGPVTVMIEIPRLGLTGERAYNITETEEAYRESRRGRTAPRDGDGEDLPALTLRPRPRKAGRNAPADGGGEEKQGEGNGKEGGGGSGTGDGGA